MSDNGLHLHDVIDSIRKHRGLIAVITIITAIAGAIFYLAGPKKYEAKTEFVIRNPLYGDKNNLYNYETRFLDYFGNEDDVDRILLMAGSNLVQGQVIRNMHLSEAYKEDTSTSKGLQQLERKFTKNFNVIRTEYKGIVLSYVDTDPKRASDVANESVNVLEKTFSGYYSEMRRGMYQSIQDKIKEEDSTINALTDTLSILRDQYGIYDIISPSRFNLMLGSMKGGGKNYGRAVEVIQNIESLKDQVVTDRSKHATIVNQMTTGIREGQLPMLKVVTIAKPPISPKGLGGMYTVLACAFFGFFFGVLLVLFNDRYLARTPVRNN